MTFPPGKRGLNQLQHASSSGNHDSGEHAKDRGVPLTIQGLRSNTSEKEFHAVFFDVEALIGIYFLTYIV